MTITLDKLTKIELLCEQILTLKYESESYE